MLSAPPTPSALKAKTVRARSTTTPSSVRFLLLRLARRLILPQALQVVQHAAAAVIPEPHERRLGVGKGRTSSFRTGVEGPGSAHRAPSARLPKPVDADPVVRWKGSASETTTTTEHFIPARQRAPRNRGRLIGQKRPLKPKDVWTIRVQLQMEGTAMGGLRSLGETHPEDKDGR